MNVRKELMGRKKQTVIAIGAFALAWGASGVGHAAGTVTAIPCAAKAKAVIANTGQSIHNANSTVQGDVQAATSILRNSGSVITGTSTPNTPAHLAVVPPPAGAINLGNFVVSGHVTLTAGNYVASSFNMNGGSSLSVTGGIVQVWVTGGLVLLGPANSGGDPTNLEFLVTGTQDAHVNSNTQFFGFIYAPNAPVLIDSVVHGSIVGSTTTINSNGQVIFVAGDECPVCTPPLVSCGGMCIDDQSDPNNCGACGNVCPTGDSCELGVCTPPGACLPGSSTGVLVQGTTVDSYVPLGDWITSVPNVVRVRLEGPATPNVTIPTALPVNSCGSNAVTGVTVCTSNGSPTAKDVYVISGTTVGQTLQSGAAGTQSFSGGSPFNAGVAIDPVHNVAVLAVGTATGAGAFQVAHLGATATAPITLDAPIPAGGTTLTAEDMVIDPGRNFVLSPAEPSNDHDYVILNLSSSTVFNFIPTTLPSESFFFDSAAEDCSTGIALSTMEEQGALFLANLPQATFSAPTWSAPSQVQNFTVFNDPTLSDGTNGIAIESGTHLGVVAGEFGGAGFGVIQLPASAVTGPPAVVDWVQANVPNDPSGATRQMGRDPHTVTVYRSPSSGRAFAVIANEAKTFLAIVDMQALLSATRSAANTVATIGAGIVQFIAI
jgi:hypothetical protein